MKNLDAQNKETLEIQNKIAAAIESGNSEDLAKSMASLAKGIEANILQEAKQSMKEDLNDMEVLTKRGLNPLTAEERTYYNEVITAGGFSGSEKLMPSTVIDRVFEDLKISRPLLSEISFVNTTGVTEWVTRQNGVEAAWWGKLCEAIKKKLENAFIKQKTELYKLSAYVPVCKSMLDLGPEWLDRFVREILSESVAAALELAIIAGTGKDQPIGMMKDLAGAVLEGVYPDKTPVKITDFKPATLGTQIMAPLTREGTRSVDKVLMIVNPVDYWEKIFAMTTVRTLDGGYAYGIMPIPVNIIQSVAMPKGKMVVGLAKDYFMGVGSERKIEYSDQYKFLEDERIYITKQYANGKPMDNKSFITFDISGLVVPVV